MAKTANPFNTSFDYAEFAKFFDPAKYDLEKFSEAFKVPAMDASVMMEAQRRNIETLTAVNKIAFEGVQTIARRQVEIARQAVQDAGEAMKAINNAKTFEERVAKQAEVMKSAYAKGVADLRELGELGAKSSQEAAEVLNARVAEGLDELGKTAKKAA
ncbi:MAG: phasin family protein [Kiloniellales bacterium]|nr:phasin family protein [Kiloniellales bacterium]